MIHYALYVCVNTHTYILFFSTFSCLLCYNNRLMMDFSVAMARNVLREWVLEKNLIVL